MLAAMSQTKFAPRRLRQTLRPRFLSAAPAAPALEQNTATARDRLELKVTANTAGMRLDRFIRAALPQIPQSLLARLLRQRQLTLLDNGVKKRGLKADLRVSANQIVTLPHSFADKFSQQSAVEKDSSVRL